MYVILLERIEKLGQMGDVVKVKAGFARNYLLPQKKALRATENNKRVFEAQKVQLEAQNLENRKSAEAVSTKMDGEKVVLIRQAGEAGQLYGSVNARDVAEALEAAGFTVARHQVELARPIKTLGLHDVIVRLHPEVTVTITANVARTPDEAQVQSDTGVALVGDDAKEAADIAAEAAEAIAAQADAVFEEEVAGEAVAEAAEDAADEAQAAAKKKADAEARALAAAAAEAAAAAAEADGDDADKADEGK